MPAPVAATRFGGARAARTPSRVPAGTRTSQLAPGGVTPRIRVGLSAFSISNEIPAFAESFRRSVADGTATRSVSGVSDPMNSKPYWPGSRPITVAAWIAGTNSLVSRRRKRVRANTQKSVEPVARIALSTTADRVTTGRGETVHEVLHLRVHGDFVDRYVDRAPKRDRLEPRGFSERVGPRIDIRNRSGGRRLTLSTGLADRLDTRLGRTEILG